MLGKLEVIETNFTSKTYSDLKSEMPFDSAGIITGYDSSERFVPFCERESKQVFPKETIRYISYGKGKVHWKGVRMQKDPICLTTYQQLIFEVKPKTIFELGAFEGGSAIFFADYLDTLALNSKIYSLDIAPELLHPLAQSDKRINFLKCDLNLIHENEEIIKILENQAHPWVIIEDAHVNLFNVLNFLSNYMTKGDYIIVEDTNPLKNGTIMNPITFDITNFNEFGDEKLNILKKWAEERDDFLVDTYYCDFFGYNSTINMNGYLKKMK